MEQLMIVIENLKQMFNGSTDIKMLTVGGIAVFGVLIVFIIYRRIKGKKIKSKLEALEQRYSVIKNTPLMFKLNKAVALARVNEQVNQTIIECKADFEEVQEKMKIASSLIGETDDYLFIHKSKLASQSVLELSAIMIEIEEASSRVMSALDYVLEQEHVQREQINIQKDQYRDLKKQVQAKRHLYGDTLTYIDEQFNAVEQMFSVFEEWMFAAEFDKACQQQGEIIDALTHLQELVEHLPSLNEKGKGVLPTMMKHTTLKYANAKNLNLFLNHLDVLEEIEKIRVLLYEDLQRLQKGDLYQVEEHFLEHEQTLQLLNQAIDAEVQAYHSIEEVLPSVDEQLKQLEDKLFVVDELYGNVKARFGFDDWEQKLMGMGNRCTELIQKRFGLVTLMKENKTPCSKTIEDLEAFHQELFAMFQELNEMNEQLENACSDELRAKKQLVKLQVILNDIKISIHKHHLPSISEKYQQDLEYANLYVVDVVKALDVTPLDVEDLNNKVQLAIDFVYKLYNNVNNLVGIAALVEETITLGNRYRSTMPEIDSNLTRAELCFRNGEYTKALKIAVSAIEKIHPGAYEKILAKAPITA